MKLEEFINVINYCVAAKVYIPKLDYDIVISAINYDHLIEIINIIKHFNCDAYVEAITYYD